MIITTFANTFEAYTREDQIYELEWDKIAELLTEFRTGKVKEYIPMFNLWQLRTVEAEEGRIYHDKTRQSWDYIPGTIRRCGDNAVGLWGLVLDYDGNKSIQECINDFVDIEYVIYTTFNHSPIKEKFRVVIPFTRMMTIEEFPEKLQSMIDTFPGCDDASFSLTQAIHMHSALDKQFVFTKHNKGIFLNPDHFESVKVKTTIETVYNPNTDDDFDLTAYKTAVFDALKTCSNVRRGANGTNGGGLTLAAIIKSVHGSFAEFQYFCNTIAAFDSCLRDHSVQSSTWYAVDTETRIKKATRDKFLTLHSGLPLCFKKEDKSQRNVEQLKEFLKK